MPGGMGENRCSLGASLKLDLRQNQWPKVSSSSDRCGAIVLRIMAAACGSQRLTQANRWILHGTDCIALAQIFRAYWATSVRMRV